MEVQKRRPMFGPKAGSKVWQNQIKRDVKLKNLEKARQAKKENAAKRLADSNKEQE